MPRDESGARAFRKIIESRNFDPDSFVEELMTVTSIGEKRVILDIIVAFGAFATDYGLPISTDPETIQILTAMANAADGMYP